jgi:hypothetical protein
MLDAMRELSVREIAAALAGYPGDPSAELRVLILYQTDAAALVDREINLYMSTSWESGRRGEAGNRVARRRGRG